MINAIFFFSNDYLPVRGADTLHVVGSYHMQSIIAK
jgi:hypothetical protein